VPLCGTDLRNTDSGYFSWPFKIMADGAVGVQDYLLMDVANRLFNSTISAVDVV
jgi:hypothetical protein